MCTGKCCRFRCGALRRERGVLQCHNRDDARSLFGGSAFNRSEEGIKLNRKETKEQSVVKASERLDEGKFCLVRNGQVLPGSFCRYRASVGFWAPPASSPS